MTDASVAGIAGGGFAAGFCGGGVVSDGLVGGAAAARGLDGPACPCFGRAASEPATAGGEGEEAWGRGLPQT